MNGRSNVQLMQSLVGPDHGILYGKEGHRKLE